MKIKKISIEEFTYPLTDDRIAKYPLEKRDASKLLVYKEGKISHDIFKNLATYLPENSLLVANNTKVIRARLEFFKNTGARIEVFCLEPYEPSDYNLSFAANKQCTWVCIVGNLKKWKNGTLEKNIQIENNRTLLKIDRTGTYNDAHIINFQWDNPKLTFSDIIENLGNIPIPPYLNREAEISDLTTYQTIYSKHKGSVAAPTAGLHFTDEVFNSLEKHNNKQHLVTLHVGAGTFKPVKAENIGQHEMHTEHFVISTQTIPQIIKNLSKITAVGTTTVRTLESFYWLGVKIMLGRVNVLDDLHLKQWEAYTLIDDIPVDKALESLHNWVVNTKLDHVNASTAIMIAPGYKFKVVDRIITNFHQPKSTLLLLISAYVGQNWKQIYDYALNNEFRFLSYGDSCLLDTKKGQ